MRCLYCDSEINKYNLYSLFVEEDKLCLECRTKLKINKKVFKIDDLDVMTLYDYDSIFKELLIQYKECYDEALAEVFLYRLNEYLSIKYYGYKILFVLSSKLKQNQRGFSHLELIYKDLHLKRVNGLYMINDCVQEGKNKKERELMKNNYIYKGDNLDKVLIVDDVITTGSSVLGVYNAIKPYINRAKVLALCKK